MTTKLRLVFTALVGFAISQGCRADIQVRDEGEGGVTFTNLTGEQSQLLVEAGQEAGKPSLQGPVKARRGPSQAAASRERLAPLVSAAAAAHGLPETLLTAVIEAESNFNPGAVSPKGAIGLMQLMPQTARQLNVADARDPAANIDAGARYLKELLERFGNDLHLAVAAYNAGPGAVQRRGAIPPYAETRRYVPLVIRRYHNLESGGPVRR